MSLLNTQKMFDTLRHDFKECSKSGTRLWHITLPDYQRCFQVSDQDVTDYCATLTPLYTNCILCGKEWQDLNKGKIMPISNGHVFDWYDSFTIWCVDSSHDELFFYQNKDGEVDFEMNVDIDNGRSYSLRWNCLCAVQACMHQNVIYDTIRG